jgi:hypothetical protein
MVAKMLLPYGGIAIPATENKQPSKIGISQTEGTLSPDAPILDGCAAPRATHSGTIRIEKVPVPQKLGKCLQWFRRRRRRHWAWGSRDAAESGMLPDLLPESIGNLNGHAAAFSIREKQGRKKFRH